MRIRSGFELLLFISGMLLVMPFGASGQDTSRKSYSIFKPLPKSLMREDMETDRPNVTETPYTVEPGHFQFETDLVRHEHQVTESNEHRWLINQANFKFGILPGTALQVIVQSFGYEKNEELETGQKEANRGFGDVTLRLKQNLFGNYNGNFSIAVMPYVKLPTNRYSENRKYEEGLMIPMSVKLPHQWKIGFQVEGDYLKER